MNTKDQAALEALKKFVQAATELDRAWTPALNSTYPAHLPSFDEYLSEIMGWVDGAKRFAESPTFNAFPGIAIPASLTALGFKDESWGNDACARAMRGDISVWVDYDNEILRENQGEKFAVQRENDENGETLWEGESEEELLKFLATLN